MKAQNKKKQRIKSISIYFVIAIFTIIINIPIFGHVTYWFINDIEKFLSANVPFFYIRKPILLWGGGALRALALDFMINMLLLLIVEFVFIWLFRKRLNKFFKIDNLFTGEKTAWLAIIIISVQLIISCWMWQIDPQYGKIHSTEDEWRMNELDSSCLD